MKRLVLLVLAIIFFQSAGYPLNKKMVPATGVENPLPNIFIYSIPDDTDEKTNTTDKQEEVKYIENSEEDSEDAPITLIPEDLEDNVTLGATVLKGYAQYIEDSNAGTDSNFVMTDKETLIEEIKPDDFFLGLGFFISAFSFKPLSIPYFLVFCS